MKLLRADEARKIANNNDPKGIAKRIIEKIADKAEMGKYELKIRDYGFGNSNLYAGEMNDIQKEVVKILEELGYEVKLRTEAKQFVDIYLQIEW